MTTSDLPKGWRVAKLDEICSLVIGRTPPSTNPTYWGGQNPWATIGDMTASDGVVAKTQRMLSDQGAAHCGSSRLLPHGTLMFSFKLSIGHTAFSGCDLYTNEAIVGLRPYDEDLIKPSYLRWALQTVDYGRLTGFAAKGRTLNKKTLAMLRVPIPPTDEQLHIVKKMERVSRAVGRATAAMEAQLAAIRGLTKAALRQAFKL